MHKKYFLDIIREKPVLFAAVLRFNGSMPFDTQAASDALEGIYPDLPAASLAELWRYGPSRKHLRTRIRCRPEQFWDFSEESRSLALLDAATLDELALFYGASLHAPEIARTILGAAITRLRDALGDRAHAYALQRGQYQRPAGRDVFENRDRDMPLAERTVTHGRQALGIIMSGWPAVLQDRVHSVIPPDIPASPDLQRGVWFDMKKILIREVAPAWASCFA